MPTILVLHTGRYERRFAAWRDGLALTLFLRGASDISSFRVVRRWPAEPAPEQVRRRQDVCRSDAKPFPPNRGRLLQGLPGCANEASAGQERRRKAGPRRATG